MNTSTDASLQDRLYAAIHARAHDTLRLHLPIRSALVADHGAVCVDSQRLQLPGKEPGRLQVSRQPFILRQDGRDFVQAVATYAWELVTRELGETIAPGAEVLEEGAVPAIYDARVGNHGTPCTAAEAKAVKREIAQAGTYRVGFRAHEFAGEVRIVEFGPVDLAA